MLSISLKKHCEKNKGNLSKCKFFLLAPSLRASSVFLSIFSRRKVYSTKEFWNQAADYLKKIFLHSEADSFDLSGQGKGGFHLHSNIPPFKQC